jgi:hypothetical protein
MDALSNLVIGGTVNVYREGATVNGDQIGVAPLAITIRHPGKISAGDTVFIENDSATLYSVTAASLTSLTLSGFAGTLSVLNGQRIVPFNSQPTIYSDDQGGASVSQPLTTDAFGSIATSGGLTPLWTEGGAYHILAAGAGATARLYQTVVIVGESPTVVYSGERDGATAVAHVEDTRFALATAGAKLKSWRNLGVERNFMRYTGVMAGEIRYADSFAAGSSTGGIQEALNDLPAGGGIVWGPGAAQSITASISITTASTTLMLQPVALTFAVGKQITVSVDDVSIFGSGDACVLDFSAETGAVHSILCTGDRVRLRSFKMPCGRIAGSTGAAIVFSTTDTAFVDDVTINNSGSSGISTASVTDIHISNSRITSARKSGIFCDSGLTGLWVRDNKIASCVVDGTGGHSGIAVRGNVGGVAQDSDIHIAHNSVTASGTVGITVNSGVDPVNLPTRHVFITENLVDGTTTGEGIAFTASDIAVSRNRVNKSAVVGILCYSVAKRVTISDNIVSDSSQGASTHSAIQCHLGTNGAGAISDVTISGNKAFDDQGGSVTQGSLCDFDRGSGGTFSRIYFHDNISNGVWVGGTPLTNLNDTISYANLLDRSAVVNHHHTSDFFTQNITSAVSTLTAYTPTLFLTADNNYTITGAPTINDGYEGQLLTIINVDTADTITLQDQGTLANSNLRLSAATIALGPRDSIVLRFSSTVGDWVQVGQVNVI